MSITMKKSLRVICCILIAAVAFTMIPAVPAYANDMSKSIPELTADVYAAKAELKAAQAKYDKEVEEARAKVKLTADDLKLVGREFIYSLVKEAYASDKNDGVEKIHALYELSVKGYMGLAKANSTCKSVINTINSNAASADYSFEGMVNRALSIENLNKAMDLIDSCNSYRKKKGLEAYTVSPYLMAGASVSAALSSVPGHVHCFVNTGQFTTYDYTRVWENMARGFDDPFTFWYDREKPLYDQGVKNSDTAHIRQILSKSYNQTGASWNDQSLRAEQCFTKDAGGKSYTTAQFRKRLNDYVEEVKPALLEKKRDNLPIVKNKPSYLTKAEKKLEDARAALSAAVADSKPSIKVLNYSYDNLNISYTVPDGFDGIMIYRSKVNKTGTFQHIATLNYGRYHKDTGLTNGVIYYYKACYYKIIGGKRVKSQYSDVVSRMVRPGKVSNVKASVSGGKLTITWNAIRGAQNYRIYVKKQGEAEYKRLIKGYNIYGLELHDRAMTSNKAVCTITQSGKYYIKVRAFRFTNGKKVNGYFSNPISVIL